MDDAVGFDEFVAVVRPQLARAFAASYGIERGQEALAEAMGYAWEHFEAVGAMENPTGYLYRVGQSRSRPRRRNAAFPAPASLGLPDVEPRLAGALQALSERQRTCVMLVFAFEWTHEEVAHLLGLSRSTVQNHVERGLHRLRGMIGAPTDV